MKPFEQSIIDFGSAVAEKIDLRMRLATQHATLWLTYKVDVGEGYLVSERIMSLVKEKLEFRYELMQKTSSKNQKHLLQLVTPEGVRRKNEGTTGNVSKTLINGIWRHFEILENAFR